LTLSLPAFQSQFKKMSMRSKAVKEAAAAAAAAAAAPVAAVAPRLPGVRQSVNLSVTQSAISSVSGC
jgi:hypothetical protein